MNLHIEEVKNKILPILQHYGVKRAGLFGSCVRNEMIKDSDIDILVEIEKDISLLDFVGLKLEIEDVLKRKVDILMRTFLLTNHKDGLYDFHLLAEDDQSFDRGERLLT